MADAAASCWYLIVPWLTEHSIVADMSFTTPASATSQHEHGLYTTTQRHHNILSHGPGQLHSCMKQISPNLHFQQVHQQAGATTSVAQQTWLPVQPVQMLCLAHTVLPYAKTLIALVLPGTDSLQPLEVLIHAVFTISGLHSTPL
jgi:hypothetical protein